MIPCLIDFLDKEIHLNFLTEDSRIGKFFNESNRWIRELLEPDLL